MLESKIIKNNNLNYKNIHEGTKRIKSLYKKREIKKMK